MGICSGKAAHCDVGQPKGNGQRPTKEQSAGHGQRTTSGDNGQRSTDNERRQRAAANEDSGVTTAQTTSATSGDRPRRAAASSLVPAPGVSNKPMVATARAWFNEHSIDPMRRHIGRPLDTVAWNTRSQQ